MLSPINPFKNNESITQSSIGATKANRNGFFLATSEQNKHHATVGNKDQIIIFTSSDSEPLKYKLK